MSRLLVLLGIFLLSLLSFCYGQVSVNYVHVGDNYLFRTAGPENPGLNFATWNGDFSNLPNFGNIGNPAQTGVTNNVNVQALYPNQQRHLFATLYTGFIFVEESGTLNFKIGSDDGSKLIIDGTLVINHDGLHGYTEKEGSVFLSRGYHAIRVEFFERLGSYSLNLFWKVAPFEIIVTPNALSQTDFNGGFAQIKVKLSRKPSQNVTVYITNPSTQVVLSTCALHFTVDNYDQDQTVAVIPVSGFSSNSPFNIEFKGSSGDERYNDKIVNVPVGKGSSSTAKCVSWGDPHFTTFDGRNHNFQGVGDFFLTRTLDASVVVQARQRICGARAPTVTCNFGVAIKYQSSVIVLEIDSQGTPSLQARSEVDPAIKLQITGTTYIFTLPEGTIVQAAVGYWGGPGIHYLNLYVTAANYQKNRVRGLCGNFDGNSGDDFAPATNEQDFGNFWNSGPGESIFNWPNTELEIFPDPQAPPSSDFEFSGTPVSCNPEWTGPTPPPGGSDSSDVLNDLPISPPQDSGTPPPFVYVPPEWSSPEFQEEAEDYCNELFFTSEAAVLCNEIIGNTNTAQEFYDHCIFDAQATDSLEFASDAVGAFLELCKVQAESEGDDSVQVLCPGLCSLKGNCTTGAVCVCNSGWKGVDCSQEDLPPTIQSIGSSAGCYPQQGSIVIRGRFFTSELNWSCVFNGGSTSPVQFISAFELACRIPSSFGFDAFFSVSIPAESDITFDSYTCPQSGSTPSPKTEPPPPACTDQYCDDTFEFQGETYSFTDFNVISYSDFNVNTGDVEGRVLVRNDFQSNAGYSVGHLLQDVRTFSLIALGNVDWDNGALFPSTSYFFAGSNFVTQSPFGLGQQRKGGNCSYCESQPCCNSVESALQAHYNCSSQQSKDLLTLPNPRAETTYEIKYNGIFISCARDSYRYVLNIDASDFNSATWYNLDQCLSDAFWTININAGSGTTVQFNGDWFPARNGKVTYNVHYNEASVQTSSIGQCIGQVSISTDVNGNLHAPHSSVVQTGGLVRGWVVACDYSASDAMQVNIPCDDSILSTLVYKGFLSSVQTTVKKSKSILVAASGSNVQVDDILTLCPGCGNEEKVSVLAVNDNEFEITAPTKSHQDEYFTTKFTPGRIFRPSIVQQTSESPMTTELPTETTQSPTQQPKVSSSTLLTLNFFLLGFVFLGLFF